LPSVNIGAWTWNHKRNYNSEIMK